MHSLRDRYESGEGCQEIADDIGCSPSTVWLRLKKQGVVFRPPGGKEITFDLDEAARLYGNGASCAELAGRFGCSAMVIWRRLRGAGVAIRAPGGVAKVEGAVVRDLYISGKSLREVAEEIGCTSTTVLRHLRAQGVQTRSRSEALSLDLDTSTLLAAYNEGVALSTIAEQMGCSTTAIKSRLVDLEAPPRPRATHQKVVLNEELLIEKYLSGLPSTALQRTFKCSYATILKRLRAQGITIRDAGSYSRRDDVDTDMLIDLYTEGWSSDRVAGHLGCSAHLVRRRLVEMGVERRSGSPHGGICVHDGVTVKVDSGWEAHVFTVLRDHFGDTIRFQGEFGKRSEMRTRTLILAKPDAVRRVYLPHRPHYNWTPDFFIPPLNLYLEVKGWHGLPKWESVIVPSIRHNVLKTRVAALTINPYRMKTWPKLRGVLHYIT